MNETLIIALVIGVPLFLFSQIRFIIRLSKIRKNPEYSPGVLFSLGGICELFICFGQNCDGTADAEIRRAEKKTAESVAKKFNEYDRKQNTKTQTIDKVTSNLDVKTRIINCMADLKKVSLLYISNTTSIPIEQVTYILSKDPNYLIEGPFVINKTKLTNEELLSFNVINRTQGKSNVTEEAPIGGICSECFSPYEQGADYCLNCGIKLN